MIQSEVEDDSASRSEYFPSKRTRAVTNLYVDLESTYITKAIKKPEGFSDPTNLGRISNKVQDSLPARTFNSIENCDVLCVNCMTMINMSMVAEHSLRCTKVDVWVRLMDQCALIQQINFRIRKLGESIVQLNKDKGLQGPINLCYVKMLAEYAGDLAKIEDCTSKNRAKCREVLENLSMVNADFSGSPKLKLYVERLFVLSKEKNIQLLRNYKDMHSADSDSGVDVVKSTKEIIAELRSRTEQLRKSKNSSHEMRASSGSDGSPSSPIYISRTSQAVDDISSEVGRAEYSSPNADSNSLAR